SVIQRTKNSFNKIPDKCFVYIILFFCSYYLSGSFKMAVTFFLSPLGYLSYTSGLSLLCMVFFLIVVIIKKFQIPCPLPILDAGNETMHMFNSTPHSDNVTTDDDTCKNGIIYNINSVTLATLATKDRAYIIVQIHVGPELLHTYSKFYKHDILLLVVRLAVLAAVTLTVPVVLFPIRTSVGHLLFPGKDFSWIRHVIITVSLLAGTNILVIFVPSIRDIFGFIGISKCFTSYETQKHNAT
uniref:Sodium-coupled neutral amino acid symporter 2 n=1 Tax=Xiphophorus couchianus TaxID=32473 RepID=A0A3B5MB95_9TELE